MRTDKALRLEQAARLYYEQNRSQQEIAEQLGVSRPLVSRMLQEAREAGIVEIRVHSLAATPEDDPLERAALERFRLRGCVLLPELGDDHLMNQSIARAALDCTENLGGGRVGLGWGHIIGYMVELLEQQEPRQSRIAHVCPMVGNSGISIRHYHSNENVRIVAQQTGAVPHYLHTPAIAQSQKELELLCSTEHYKAVSREWERLDVALVNIGNYPSTPDFASQARYGDLLTQKQAVGRFIARYVNQQGDILYSETDHAVQIPLELLQRSRHIVGVCSANVSWRALAGALVTGLFSHVVARRSLLQAVLDNTTDEDVYWTKQYDYDVTP